MKKKKKKKKLLRALFSIQGGMITKSLFFQINQIFCGGGGNEALGHNEFLSPNLKKKILEVTDHESNLLEATNVNVTPA